MMLDRTVFEISQTIAHCPKCGFEHPSCDCDVPLVKQRAAKAIAANPQKSDRAIAKELGVSPTTVGKARQVSTSGQVSKRVGLDGKKYPARPQSKVADEEIPSAEEAEESYQRDVYDQACLILEEMSGETRQRFFAYLRRKYNADQATAAIRSGGKGA